MFCLKYFTYICTMLNTKQLQMTNINIRVTDEQRTFLTKFSEQETGAKSITTAVRLLINKAMTDASK